MLETLLRTPSRLDRYSQPESQLPVGDSTTRRNWAGRAIVFLGLTLFLWNPLARAASSQLVTHLFTNWSKVDAGNAIFSVNLDHVSEKDQRLIEKVNDYYKVTMKVERGERSPGRVNTATGVKIEIEKGQLLGPWLQSERPWEKAGVGPLGVIQEGNRYRLWYGCSWTVRDRAVVAPDGRLKLGSEGGGSGVCYAESSDGFNWERASLGMVEFEGSRDNNIFSLNGFDGITGHVFLDPNAPKEERYKVAGLTNIRTYRPQAKSMGGIMGAAVSPDGIRWKRLPEPFWDSYFNNDGGPSIYFDQKLEKYVLFTRQNYPRRRSIARAETADFRRWPHPTLVLTPGPMEAPSDDFYNNTYVSYPGAEKAHLMLTSVYHRDTSLVDIRLASSVDGIAWNWVSRDPVLELGRPGDWNGGSMYAVPSMIKLPDGRVAVPMVGSSWSHNEWWRVKFETHQKWPRGIGWATWEDGRLSGIKADKRGEFTTHRFVYRGKELELNLRTGGRSGSVRLELLVEGEPERTPLRSRDIVGDHLWVPVPWEGNPELSALTGKTVRLRFQLYNAKLFGFRSEGMVGLDPQSSPPASK